MAQPEPPSSPFTHSRAPLLKLVTVSAITADGKTALCTDRSGVQYSVPLFTQTAKGVLPTIGDNWYIGNSSGYWLFANYVGSGPGDFPALGGGGGGNTSSALGLYVYDGNPADGNPPVAYVSTSTSDPYANLISALARFGKPSFFTIGPDGSIIFYGSTGQTLGAIALDTADYTQALNLFQLPVLCYDGDPAAGNLVLSIAGKAGTDKFGNSYPKGLGTTAGSIPGSTITGQAGGSTTPVGAGQVLNYNPYFQNEDITGWTAYPASNGLSATGANGGPYDWSVQLVSSGTSYVSLEGTVFPFQIQAQTQYLVTAWVNVNAPGNHTINIGLDFLDGPVAGVNYFSSAIQGVTVTGNTWTPVSGVITSPASGATYAYPRVGPAASTGAGMITLIQACLVLPQVPGTLIEAGSITAAQIYAGSIQADLIQGTNIAAGAITANNIAANTITASQVIVSYWGQVSVDFPAAWWPLDDPAFVSSVQDLSGNDNLGISTNVIPQQNNIAVDQSPSSLFCGPYFQSFESGITGWSVTNGTGTLVQDSSWATNGTNSLKFTMTSTGASLVGGQYLQILPDAVISCTADLKNTGTVTVSEAGIEIAYFTSPNSTGYIGSSYSTEYSLTAGTVKTGVTASGTAPSNAAWYRIKCGDYNPSGVNSGRAVNIDNILTSMPSGITTPYVPGALSAFSIEIWVNLDNIPQLTSQFPQIVANSNTSGTNLGFEFYMGGSNNVPVVNLGYGFPSKQAGGNGGVAGAGQNAIQMGAGGGGGASNNAGGNGAPGMIVVLCAGQAPTVLTTPGSGTYNVPTGITQLNVLCWGGGGGAGDGSTASGAGAGEFAQETTLAVTPGGTCAYTVGAGGTGATTAGNGTAGGNTTFAGTSVIVTAHGGGTTSGTGGGTPGTGGTGSTNSIHFNGANGGQGGVNGSTNTGGGGGGSCSSANTGGAGNPGTSGGTGGLGGSGGLGGWLGFSAGNALPAGDQWTHLVITWNGATVISYVNGVQYSSTAWTPGATGVLLPGDGPLTIGSNVVNQNSNQWNGLMSEAIFYTYALPAGRVAAHYTSRTGAITADQIAADTVVAKIVDGTTITGAQFVADGTAGEILVYDGPPQTGNLIVAISGQNSQDAYGNTYTQGLNVDAGIISGSSYSGDQMTLQPGPALIYGDSLSTILTFTSSTIWTPPGNGTVSCCVIGPGGQGCFTTTGGGGGGGGGSAINGDSVTGGVPYTITVGTGGSGVASSVTFNTRTITGGAGGSANSGYGGAAGVGSTTGGGGAVHNGGKGGNGLNGSSGSGGGGAGGGGPGGNGKNNGTGGVGGSASGLWPAGGHGGGSGNVPGRGYGGAGGGGVGTGIPAGAGNGVIVIYYTQTSGATTLLLSGASQNGTDPVTLATYQPGWVNYEPTFGNYVQLWNGGIYFTNASGQTFESADITGQRYYTCAQENSANVYIYGRCTQNITADTTISGATVLSLSFTLAPNQKYRVRGQIWYIPNQAAGTAIFSWSTSQSVTMWLTEFQGFVLPTLNSNGGQSFDNAMVMNSRTAIWGSNTFTSTSQTRTLKIDGFIINGSTLQSIALASNVGTSGDTFTIKEGSYLEVYPCS